MTTQNAIMSIISQTDWVSKFILLLFLSLSLICWTVSIYKLLVLRSRMQQLKQAKALLRNIVNTEDFLARASTLHNTFIGNVISNFLADFKSVAQAQPDAPDWQLLQEQMVQTVDVCIQQEEYSLPLLSTSAQAAPLIGLFGTVWGLIHAFLAIAAQKSTDISAVAPGIAEALITTLGGLVVAIPALIMFNYLQSKMRVFEQALMSLTDMCYLTMKAIMHTPHRTPEVFNNAFVTPTQTQQTHELKRDAL